MAQKSRYVFYNADSADILANQNSRSDVKPMLLRFAPTSSIAPLVICAHDNQFGSLSPLRGARGPNQVDLIAVGNLIDRRQLPICLDGGNQSVTH
jgi:hypothetical protein